MTLSDSQISSTTGSGARLLAPGRYWTTISNGSSQVYLRGCVQGRSHGEVAAEALGQTRQTVAKCLDRLDGHFAIVVTTPHWSFAAVDPVRSYPLIWAMDGQSLLLSHDGSALESRLGLGASDIDQDQACAVALSGFTIGNATLYPQVKQLGPGEYLWIEDGCVSEQRYHRWTPWLPDDVSPEDLREPLSRLNQKLIEDLIQSAEGRPVLLPLSAGLDSRFIASGLKEFGYDNVRCVAYGLAGNREAETSQLIAKRLGYEWTFVPYTQSEMRAIFHSTDYAAYKAYSDSLTSMHFPQEYPMLAAMLNEHDLETDTICVNGQSGDFIAGNHVPASLFETSNNRRERTDRIINALVTKHYKHWSSLVNEKSAAIIGAYLEEEIGKLGGLPDDPSGDHGIYEYCEFQDRQSKYVINGQRAYEFFGLDWRLPLWDRAYLDFWARAPLSAKRNESLYRSVLEADNWGGVWKDIPVNPTRIRPAWLAPLRLAAKVAHAPFGRKRWHDFERRYLNYWMSATCAYAAWPYRQVATDRRGFYSASAWHIADYVESKGLNWDGSRKTGLS